MKRQYRYILVVLIGIILYELYLVFSFKYVDIQKDMIINETQKFIESKKAEIKAKNAYFAYINTIAYRDKIAKTSQNMKNPWEELIAIVSKEDVEQYKKIDIQKQMLSEKEVKSPTYSMTNWQKWIYMIFKKDLTEQ